MEKDMTEIERLNKIFTFQPVKPGQQEKYLAIREAAKQFAIVVTENAPSCADRSAAIRKIREAVVTANAAIALDGVA